MKKSVCIDKDLARRLLDWHSGQWSALYSLGSSQCVPEKVARDAVYELSDVLSESTLAADRRDLIDLIVEVRKAIRERRR